MIEHRSVGLVVLACCLVLAGCSGFGPSGSTAETSSDAPTAAEVAAEIDSVDSYGIDVNQTLKSTGLTERTELSGVVDRSERAARIRRTVNSSLGENDQVTQYVLDGVEYVDGEDGWKRAPLSEGDWSEIDRLGRAGTAIEDGSLERIRTEEVAGTETVLFEVDLPTETQDELTGTNESEHVPMVIEEFKYYIYIEPDTATLYRTDLRALVTQGGGGTAKFTVETTVTGHNESVDVRLPEDAPSVEP